MAYNLISTNGDIQYNINEYVVDEFNDLKKLPSNCKMGSIAYCIADGNYYVKNSKGEWKPKTSPSSGSSGNTTVSIRAIPMADIRALYNN